MALLLAVSALGLQLLIFPLPKVVTAKVLDWSSTWILADSPSSSVIERGLHKFTSLKLQQSLADHLREAQSISKDLPDVERMKVRLMAVRTMMADQTEIPHNPLSASASITGLGHCDAINGFAALLLSEEFDKAEIIGVVDPPTAAGHSYGRVWSAQLEEWLYFDLWGGQVVIFRSRAGAKPQYLFRKETPSDARSALFMETLGRLHARAGAGVVHNRLQPTLGGYLFERVRNWIAYGHTAPAGAIEALDPQKRARPRRRSGFPRTPPDPAPRMTVAADEYVSARFHHHTGDLAAARRGYRAVIRREGARPSIYGRAARVFLERMAVPRE